MDPYYFYDPVYWFGGWLSWYPNNYYSWHDDTHHRPGHKAIPPAPMMGGIDSHRMGAMRPRGPIGGMSPHMGSRMGMPTHSQR